MIMIMTTMSIISLMYSLYIIYKMIVVALKYKDYFLLILFGILLIIIWFVEFFIFINLDIMINKYIRNILIGEISI